MRQIGAEYKMTGLQLLVLLRKFQLVHNADAERPGTLGPMLFKLLLLSLGGRPHR